MTDIQTLTSRIKKNCNISDAKFWGCYSLCGLLMRLRELYRAESGMRPYEKIPLGEIGKWISEREELWKELEEKDFMDIPVNGTLCKPFEIEKINGELEKKGLLYGAGYGLHMKPVFFLADLISKRKIQGYDAYIAGREYVRDLSDYPAMLQDRVIIARVEPAKLLLWQRLEEFRCGRAKCALSFAFAGYGITPDEEPSEDLDRRVSEAAFSEVETYIYHELGEAIEGDKIGDDWKSILTVLSSTRAEIFARAVKDILSDTSENGMLRYIIENSKQGSLGFYIVFLSGMRKVVFPEVSDAFRMFTETGDWIYIEDARKAGYRRAAGYMERVLSLYKKYGPDREQFLHSMEDTILAELL